MPLEAPACPCHGVPQYWHKMKDMRSGGLWRCREARKARDASRWQGYYYERMAITVRVPWELANRHRKALARHRERDLRS